MFRRLQLLPAMLLILAELIAVSASSSLSLSAAAGGGITDFAMPGMLPPFETSGCSACVSSWSCVILSYSLLNIAETQPTGKMIVTLRLCLYLPETGVAGVMLDLDRLWIVCRLMFDACDPSSSFLWRSTTPAYLRRSGSNSDGCCAARNP